MTTQESQLKNQELLQKQENEEGPKITGEKEGHRHCFVCRSPIAVGLPYYFIRCGSSTIRRHTTCQRKQTGKKKVTSDQQIGSWSGRAIKKEIEDHDA